MASLLEWTFKLNDKVSPGARSSASSLGEFIQTAHSAIAVMGYAANAAIQMGAGLAAGIAPAIEREKTLGAFETMLGDSTKAVNLYTQAVKFANETPFETQDVVSGFKQLLAAQFKKEDLQAVVTIVGDAASLQQFPQQAMESVNRALGQIKSKGKLSQEELNQVAEAVPLNQQRFLENTAKLYGVSLERARQLKETGKISGDSGVFLVLQTLQQQFGGSMQKASKQVAGLWSTIKSAPVTYLEQLQDTRGFEALRGSLSNIVTLLDPESPRGQSISLFIKDLGSGVLERASVTLDYLTAGATAFFDGLRVGLGPMNEAFGPANQTNIENFKNIMDGLGTATGRLLGYADRVGDFFSEFYQFGEWLAAHPWAARLLYIGGGALAGSVVGGPVGTVAGALAGATAYATMADAASAESVGAKGTPYRASQTDLALALGAPMMADGGIVTRPTLALIGEAGPEEVRPLSDMRTPPITVHFSYSAGSGTGDDREALNIEQRVETGILQALERWALQSGRRAY